MWWHKTLAKVGFVIMSAVVVILSFVEGSDVNARKGGKR
jgi:hypothetical protein